jgi:tetratricopeptide (TPR) repeat protein
LLDGKQDAGREALERFIAVLRPGEGGEARLVAHMELAALHHEQGRFEASIAEYQAAIEALPEDPRPYLAMATFFRRQGLAAESVDVLEAASGMLEDEQRPWRLTAELGLAHADLGHDNVAGELLEEVIAYFTKRQQMDFPPEPALRLALLHEKTGNQARALDLYHLLAQGSDVLNHCAYYRQAARLMLALGHISDARRMLQRASEVAPDVPEIRAEIAAELDKLK